MDDQPRKGDLEIENVAVFGLTNNHAAAVASVLMDISVNSPGTFDGFVIFHDGLSLDDMHHLAAFGDIDFKYYEFPFRNRDFLSSWAVQHFTEMVFSKLELFRLAETYRNVVWLDYDIRVIKPLNDLIHPSPHYMKVIPGGTTVRGQFRRVPRQQPLDWDREGISGGTFSVSGNLPDAREVYNFALDFARVNVHYMLMPDQAVIDAVIQRFEIPVQTLNPQRYTPHPNFPQEELREALILHSYGQPKFWNGLFDAGWESNYSRWQAAGGSQIGTVGISGKSLQALRVKFARFRSGAKTFLPNKPDSRNTAP